MKFIKRLFASKKFNDLLEKGKKIFKYDHAFTRPGEDMVRLVWNLHAEDNRNKYTVEMYPLHKTNFHIACNFSHDFEDTFGFSIAIPYIFSFYFGFDSHKLANTDKWCKFLGKTEKHSFPKRETRISIYEGSLWVRLWYDDDAWDDKVNWKYSYWNFNPMDWAFGSKYYDRDILLEEEKDYYVTPFEKYKVRFKLDHVTVKRKRLFKSTYFNASLHFDEESIPLGKNEFGKHYANINYKYKVFKKTPSKQDFLDFEQEIRDNIRKCREN